MTRMTELSILIAGVVVAGQAAAQTTDPYAKPDESWISISGTVVNPGADSFMLDYGDSVIIVELDDWDAYGEAHALLDGDKVTVYGRIDDDLFQLARIEAASVYLESLNTFLYASADDEEGNDYTAYFWDVPFPLVVNRATLRGSVTSVKPDEREFTIDTGLRKPTRWTTTRSTSSAIRRSKQGIASV